VEESDLFSDDVWKLDEGRIERFDLALGEIFHEAAQGDKVISLSDGLKVFTILW